MRYLRNQILIFVIQISTKFGRGLVLRKKIFSFQKILEKNFPSNKEFSFVQVGANDGISFDFLYEFVISRKSSGVVIEPVADYFKELALNYSNYPAVKKINKAVHSFEKSIKIYRIKESRKQKYPDWAKGIASFDENHHKRWNISKEDIEVENVSADTLMNIISDSYSNKKIDYLQIDTEGYDLEILKMLDFKLIKPLIIKYEHVNLEKIEIIDSMKFLNNKGYLLFKEGNDTIGIDLARIRLI